VANPLQRDLCEVISSQEKKKEKKRKKEVWEKKTPGYHGNGIFKTLLQVMERVWERGTNERGHKKGGEGFCKKRMKKNKQKTAPNSHLPIDFSPSEFPGSPVAFCVFRSLFCFFLNFIDPHDTPPHETSK